MSILSQGVTFEISDDGITYENLGCVKSWTIDRPGRTEIDVTCTSDTTKQFKFGLPDVGTVSVEYNYEQDSVSTGSAFLTAGYEATSSYWFKVIYNHEGVETTKTFKAFVITLGESGTVDDVVTASTELKIDGAIVVTTV